MRRYALPVWILGVGLSFALPTLPAWWLWGAAFLCLLGLAWRWRRLWWLPILLFGLGYGAWRTQQAVQQQWAVTEHRQTIALHIKVMDLPQRDDKRVSFLAQAHDHTGKHYRVLLSDYHQRDWTAGSQWRITARLRAPIGEVNPRGFDREAWALARGIDAAGSVGKERQALAPAAWHDALLIGRATVSQSWQQLPHAEWRDGIALMRALSIGEQSALSDKLWQAFRPLGLNHLVSISGLHVSMVALLVAGIAKWLLRILPISISRPRTIVLLTGLAAAAVYSGLAGFAVPTLRSLLMLTAVAVGWITGGSVSAWRGWWFALGLVLLFDPTALLAVGTWLSFGLVAALLWSGSWRLEERGWHLAIRSQWSATVMSIVAVGFLFAALPIASPVVNVIAIPWFSWVLVPLALLGSLLPFYPVQWLAACLAEYTLCALVWLSEYAPEWSIASAPIPLLLLALIAVGIVLLPRGAGLKPLACIILMGFIGYRPPAPTQGQAHITVFDAGQGLAILFQTAHKQLLFDTGTAGIAQMQVIPSIRAAGIQRLDALVLSHHDDDHDGGAQAVQQALRPRQTWAGQPEFYPHAQSCQHAQSWQWDGVHFEFLQVPQFAGQKDNDHSCVLRVIAGEAAFLVTGDLGQTSEHLLVQHYGEHLYSQVLVLGHHGSKHSSSPAFLAAVAPQYGIASSGFGNLYRHPAQEVQQRLAQHRITLLRTDYQGAWQFKLDGSDKVQAQPFKTHRFHWQKKPWGESLP